MIIDGKLVSNYIKEKASLKVEEIKSQYGYPPTLAVVLVGNNPASEVYVRNKEKSCKKVGINSIVIRMDENSTQEEVENKIKELRDNSDVHGILVQLPLPKGLDKDKIIELIPGIKDVDGLTKDNVAKLVLNENGIVPCTPKGVVALFDYYKIPVEGKNITIIGRSMLVGKPLANLLTNLNATVTLCHSKTKNIAEITKKADVVVCALGKAKFLTKDMVNEKTIVIDVGINRVDEAIVGDADFENLENYVEAITPVPGGCGPMTVAELLENTIECFYKQQ